MQDNQKPGVYLSVIIPSYRDSSVLERNLPVLRQYLESLGKSSEVIVVDDGSNEIFKTKEVAERYGCRFLKNPVNQGKGAAVRRGMLAATGSYRIFTDVDIPFETETFDVFLKYLDQKEFDVVVGDRTLEDSDYFQKVPQLRRWGSDVFSFLAGRFLVGGHFDTQCGMKGFRGEVADYLFHVSRINGFAFDVELLYVALKRNFDIKKVPVVLRCQDGTSVRIVRDGLKMLQDLVRIRANQFLGRYRETRQEKILGRYPKIRKSLPEAYQKIYEKHYLINRGGKSATTWLSQKMEGWLHRQVARDVLHGAGEVSTLELGAGTLNQLEYEPMRGPYDIVEPFRVLFQDAPGLKRVRNVFDDIDQVKNTEFDRITSVAVLEHIEDLPAMVAKAVLLMDRQGCFRAAIPNEGTLLWWMGTQFTGFEFKKKYGLPYSRLMEYEHVNKAYEIEAVLKEFFERVECRVFGLSRAVAFYRFYDCGAPRVSHAREFLAQQKAPRRPRWKRWRGRF